MKKFLSVIFTALSILVVLTNTSFAATWGKGELKLAPWAVDYFIKYIRGKHSEAPGVFVIAKDSSYAMYTYCSVGAGNCSAAGTFKELIGICEKEATSECYPFARGRTIKWKNGINKGKKESKIYTKWSDSEIRAKLTELGFLGGTTSTTTKIEKKKEKKTEEKVMSKTVSGERAIALSWEGYEDLIAGIIQFSENNNKGNIKLTLPNMDGSCEGSYSLQEGGKGTWQIVCTNNMGAAGTLKWGDSGTTGIGRDYKDKKVKFTVAKKS